MNTQTLEDRMMLMEPAELQKFAAMHKNDPYVLPLALKISDMRNKLKVAEGMKYAGVKPPTVADQAIAGINQQAAPQQAAPQQAPQQQLPEQTGIAPLNAPNIQGMADGGIAGYAAGPTEPRGVVDTAAYRKYAITKAQSLGLNPRFVDSLFRVESSTKNHPEGYDPYAKSKTGPVGIGQLTKATAAAYGLKPSDRYDPYKNMDAALAHLADLTKKYRGDEQKVAVAYNQGEGYLDAHLRQNKGKLVPEALTKAEPKKYLQRIQELSSGKQPSLAQRAIEAVIPPAQAAEENMSRVPPKNMSVAPTSVSQLPPIPTAPTAPAAPRPQAAPVDDYVDPMGGIASISQGAPQAQSGTKRPVASTLASLVDLPLNAVTGTAGEITRAISRPFLSSDEADKKIREGVAGDLANPIARHVLGVENDPAYRQGPVNAALGKVAEGVDVVGGGIADVTGANKSDVTNAINLLPFLPKVAKDVKGGKYGVDYNLPQKAKPGDAGLAMLAERSKQASAEAAAARAKTTPRPDTQQMPLAAEPVQGELFPRERTPVQGELFPETVAQPKAPKAGEFAIGPEALAMQERIAQVRGEQSKVAAGLAERRAKDAAAAEAKYRAELENKTPSIKDKLLNAAEKTVVPTQGVLGAAQQTKVPPRPEKRPYEAFEKDFVGTDARLIPAPEDLSKKEKKEVVADVKASPEGKEIKKTGLELSDKDWLNMGLNLLSAKSEGQQGLAGFLSNVGTAGKETLAQKQEREKIEAAKAFQDIQGRYYETIAGNIGKPQGEERMIERIAKEQGMSFADAAEQFYTMRQPDRTNIAALTKVYEDAKLYNPAYKDLTFQQWLQANGIGQSQSAGLSAAGQEAFSRNRTQISG
jgi:hypothetical protein